MELISSLSEFLTQRRKGAEARNRPLRAPTTNGEVGRPSERECREYAERLGEVGEWWKDVEKFMVASL